jgi:hypothetical protein
MKEAMDCRHIQSCAACGFRGYQLGNRMNVDTDLQWLEMSAEALSHFQAKSLLYQQVSSSVLRSGKRYHLHQELVAADGSTWICDDCNQGAQGGKLNPMSLKAGVDYGRLSRAPGLSKLTMVEQALVANNRFYATTLHCSLANANSGLKMKGHAISMQQDSLKKMASTFAGRIESVVEDMTIIFEGPRALLKNAHTAGSMATLLTADQENILNHIVVFADLMPDLYPAEIVRDITEMNRDRASTAFQQLEDTLFKQAICIEDEDYLRQTDKIARYMTENVAISEEMLAQLGDDAGFQHVCILPRHISCGHDEVEEAAASAVCAAMDIPKPSPTIITTGAAINEFNSNHAWCVGSFPWVFPLGADAAKLPQGPLNAKVRRHILNQFHNAGGHDLRLIFGFANQSTRHEVIRSVSKQRVSSGKLQEFNETLASTEFQDLVVQGQGGDTEARSAIVHQLAPIIEHVMLGVNSGKTERGKCVNRIYALFYQFGPPSLFLTVSPDAVHDPASVMMSFPSNATFDHEAFLREFKQSGAVNLGANCTPIELGTAKLKRLFAANPVASVESFNKKVQVILEIFLGFKRNPKKSQAPGLGALGRAYSHYLIVEAQGRGCLHFHMLFWGTFSPHLIQAASTSAKYKDIVSAAIESMVACELPRQTHLQRLVLRASLAQKLDGSCYPPVVMRSPDDVSFATCEPRAHAAVLEANMHHHCFTCHKGKNGTCQCRMCMPAGRLNCTGFTYLEPDAERPYYTASEDIPTIDLACTPGRDLQIYPIPAMDHRLISLGVKRRLLDNLTAEERAGLLAILPSNSVDWINSVLPLQNGLVSAFNTELMAVFACNQNFALTGSHVDAKNVTYYVAKYMAKDAHAIAETAGAFFLAQKHVDDHGGSTAPDADTSIRKAQYLLTNTINRIEGAIEVSQDQAANTALGFSADQCSHTFWNCYIGAAVSFVLRTQKERSLSATLDQDVEDACGDEGEDGDDSEDGSEDEADSEDGSEDEGMQACEDEAFGCGLEKDRRPGRKDHGTTEIYTGASGTVAVAMYTHYAHRGDALAGMTLYEYSACIHIAPFSLAEIAANLEAETSRATHASAHRNDVASAGPGRKCNKTFAFDALHPLCKSHKQQLRSMQKIPTLVPPPPRMPEGIINADQQKDAQAAAAFYMVLHCSWSWEKLPGTSHADWIRYCSQLQTEGSVVSLHRIAVMTNMSHGLGISTANDKASTSWRNRNVKVWNSKVDDGTARPPGLGHDGTDDDEQLDRHRTFDADTEDAITQILALSKGALSVVELEKRLKKMNKEDERIEALMKQVLRAFPKHIQRQPSTSSSLPCGKSSDPIPFELRSKKQSELATNWLRSEALPLDDEVVCTVSNPGTRRLDPTTIQWPNTDALTAMQLTLTEALRPLLLLNPGDPNYTQSRSILIHGGPGTGKTFFLKHLAEAMNVAKCKMRSGAFAACASQLIPFGNTIHSLVSVPMEYGPVYKPLQGKELIKLRQIWANVRVIVIDEVSMVTELLMGWVSLRLRQIMDVPLPFGGLISITIGDFFQIPSVIRPTLAESVLLAAAKEYTVVPGSVSQEAINIMQGLICYRFNIQKRSEDAQWSELLKDMRETGMVQPILNHLRHIRDIPAEEAANWTFPTVAVTGNAFRHRFNEHQLQRFACMHNLPLFRWTNDIVKSSPAMTTESTDALRDANKSDFRFSQSFCFGAPITLNENLCPMATERGVSNGTKCTLHAISGSERMDRLPYIDAENPSAQDVWIKCPEWVVVATVDVFVQANFPGHPIPPESLTQDGRLLIFLKSKRGKSKRGKNWPVLEYLTHDKRLRRYRVSACGFVACVILLAATAC